MQDFHKGQGVNNATFMSLISPDCHCMELCLFSLSHWNLTSSQASGDLKSAL